MAKNNENDNLENDINELQGKIAELTAGWQRTQADFINYKRQAQEDRTKLIKCASENLISAMLPILDNFQLAAKHVPTELENNNWVVGIKQIEKQFESVLAEEGLERIESVGKEFDPMLHEAIENVESEEPEGKIVEEALSGYRLNGETLRPAKVKVSAGSAK